MHYPCRVCLYRLREKGSLDFLLAAEKTARKDWRFPRKKAKAPCMKDGRVGIFRPIMLGIFRLGRYPFGDTMFGAKSTGGLKARQITPIQAKKRGSRGDRAQ